MGETVRQARERYLNENGFSTDTYDAPTFRVTHIPFAFRNTKGRKRAIPLHDLHHVATGYGTDFTGEAEIGAWELRTGCDCIEAYLLNGTAALIGLFIAPRRTLRAWAKGRSARSLYRLRARPDDVLDLTVEALREKLGLPERGIADHPPGIHA